MPITTAYETRIDHVSILDEHGVFDETLGKDLIPEDQLPAIMEHLVFCRQLDETAFKLQRSGRMGTYPQNTGQEMPSLAAALAIDKADWLVTCYRENTGLFWHGLPPECILLHWMGDERGNHIPAGVNATPIAIPIGTQMLHAAGLAWAEKAKKTGAIAVTFFGDGATSEGDFHEAANFAASLKLPVVFCCQNNGWAISVPSSVQSAGETFAQRGISYGMPCVRADGNDLFAMTKVMKDAVARARAGEGPTFIEAVTYRLRDHTTADDARRYRDAGELETWEARDPLPRLRRWMEAKGLWDKSQHEKAMKSGEERVAEIISNAEEIAAPDRSEFFDHMYADLPASLKRQRDSKRTTSLGQFPEDLA
jgi:pyruvate dehydrogenase E1 component alpha subunit